jgi:hypothetical protein
MPPSAQVWRTVPLWVAALITRFMRRRADQHLGIARPKQNISWSICTVAICFAIMRCQVYLSISMRKCRFWQRRHWWNVQRVSNARWLIFFRNVPTSASSTQLNDDKLQTHRWWHLTPGKYGLSPTTSRHYDHSTGFFLYMKHNCTPSCRCFVTHQCFLFLMANYQRHSGILI